MRTWFAHRVEYTLELEEGRGVGNGTLACNKHRAINWKKSLTQITISSVQTKIFVKYKLKQVKYVK